MPISYAAAGATIYADSTKKVALFTMKRDAKESGSQKTVARVYADAQGKSAVTEKIVYQGTQLLSFETVSGQNGEKGSAQVKDGKIIFSFTDAEGKTKTGTEDFGPTTIVSDQVLEYLQAHWGELVAGDEVKVRYVAVARAETVGFKFFKEEEFTQDGKAYIRIKMKPSSFVIAALVKPLHYVFEKDGAHKLVSIEGRTIPKHQVDGKWQDLDAFTVFSD